MIDRDSISKVLNEQAFQQKGCSDDKCAVKIGQLLAANKILTGKVNKLGNKYIVVGNVVDVEKGKIDYAEKVTVEDINDLDNASAQFVQKLLAKYEDSDGSKTSQKIEQNKEIVNKNNNAPLIQIDELSRKIIAPMISFFIPGLGQILQGEPFKGSFFLSGGLFAMGYYKSKSSHYDKAQVDYYASPGFPDTTNSNSYISRFLLLESIRSSESDPIKAQQKSTLVNLYFVNSFELNQTNAFLSYYMAHQRKQAALDAKESLNFAFFVASVFWICNMVDASLFPNDFFESSKSGTKISINILPSIANNPNSFSGTSIETRGILKIDFKF